MFPTHNQMLGYQIAGFEECNLLAMIYVRIKYQVTEEV